MECNGNSMLSMNSFHYYKPKVNNSQMWSVWLNNITGNTCTGI